MGSASPAGRASRRWAFPVGAGPARAPPLSLAQKGKMQCLFCHARTTTRPITARPSQCVAAGPALTRPPRLRKGAASSSSASLTPTTPYLAATARGSNSGSPAPSRSPRRIAESAVCEREPRLSWSLGTGSSSSTSSRERAPPPGSLGEPLHASSRRQSCGLHRVTSQPTKREWLAAVRGATWPSGARPIRETAKEISGLMTPDGVLTVPEARITARTGLPERTVRHHLKWLVDKKWLVHARCGGRGRLPVYLTRLPEGDAPVIAPAPMPDSRQEVAGYSAPIAGNVQVSHSARIAGKVVAGCKELQGERSEHVAVDRTRVRRLDHSGASAAPGGTALHAPRLAPVIPLRRASRNRTTAPAALAPTADGDTGPLTRPTTQNDPDAFRGVGGAGGRRLGPPKRDATSTHDPPGLDQPPT